MFPRISVDETVSHEHFHHLQQSVLAIGGGGAHEWVMVPNDCRTIRLPASDDGGEEFENSFGFSAQLEVR